MVDLFASRNRVDTDWLVRLYTLFICYDEYAINYDSQIFLCRHFRSGEDDDRLLSLSSNSLIRLPYIYLQSCNEEQDNALYYSF